MDSPFLDALNCCNKGRPPIWLMRQAGRYMPEYREIRKKYSFLQMCSEPEIINEVTLLPIHSFGVDAAILFSDILLILEALGMGLHFNDSIGPVIERPITTFSDITQLSPIDARKDFPYVARGIKLLKEHLKVPLIGFAGGPFTLASYMIEGKTNRTLHQTKRWMLNDPASFHQLLALLCECVIDCLEMQIEAGVDAVQIFDSWAGTLAYSQFHEFSLDYLQKIVQRLKPKCPVILFCKGASVFTREFTSIHPSAISFDWNANLPSLRPALPAKIAIQGNLDPDILHASKSVIYKEAARLLKGLQGDPGYIFNLGHGIHPDTPVDSVKALVEYVQSLSTRE